ncbi:MAG: FAD-dependent oxidoreductase [Pseudomonadota bacterium]
MVNYEIEDGIALLEVDNPPVNAAGQAVRAGLVAGLERAVEEGARAAVIYGAGRTFIAGADISEFGKPPADPWLPEVCNRIEATPIPVICVLHGTTLGGGLEVAMSAHWRVALPGTKVGLPEVTLGILPGAGGTQRAPRLIGAETALDLITTGKPIGADRALELGLVDRIAEGEPRAVGLALAQEMTETRRTGDMPAPAAVDFDAWHDKALKAGRGQIAPATAVRAVQAASELPFEAGLARERELFQTLMDSPQREGLIHSFFSERAVAKLPEIKGVAPREIAQLAVIGGGTMGAGIATAALLSGLDVTLLERDAEAAQAAETRVGDMLDGAVKRGKLAEDKRAAIPFRTTTDYDALSDADLIVEAVFEDMDVKQTVFRALDRVAKPGAILATNTSYLDVNQIAQATARPQDVLGLHFFSPAHVMRLLEVVVADKTAPDATATGFALAKRLRKTAVRAGVCDGFIGNRILSHWRMAADNCVLDGASPFQVDQAMTAFGMAMGPYAVSDLAGLDIGWATRKRKAATRDPHERVPSFADRLCEMGRFGRKTGRGYYFYPDATPDPEVDEIVLAERDRQGIEGREFDADEIVARIMAAMVNEAARVVGDGIASRPLDVDVVKVHGYGFPRWRGGPMKWADMTGLDRILSDIKRFAEEDDWFWQPAPLLERLVAEGRTFDDLNKEGVA